MRHSPTQDFGFTTKSEKDKVAFTQSTTLGANSLNMLAFTGEFTDATLAAGAAVKAVDMAGYIPNLLAGNSASDGVAVLVGSCEILSINIYNSTTFNLHNSIIDHNSGPGYPYLDFSGLKILSTDAASIVMTDATGDVFLTLPDHGLAPWYGVRSLLWGNRGSQGGSDVGTLWNSAKYVDANTIKISGVSSAVILANNVFTGTGTVQLFSISVMLNNHSNQNFSTLHIKMHVAFDLTNPLFLAGVFSDG